MIFGCYETNFPFNKICSKGGMLSLPVFLSAINAEGDASLSSKRNEDHSEQVQSVWIEHMNDKPL